MQFVPAIFRVTGATAARRIGRRTKRPFKARSVAFCLSDSEEREDLGHRRGRSKFDVRFAAR